MRTPCQSLVGLVCPSWPLCVRRRIGFQLRPLRLLWPRRRRLPVVWRRVGSSRVPCSGGFPIVSERDPLTDVRWRIPGCRVGDFLLGLCRLTYESLLHESIAARWCHNHMNFRRVSNRADSWRLYCHEHRRLIEQTRLPIEVFASERIFRDFATHGIASGSPPLTPEQVDALHRFITTYFDLDALLFDDFEEIRRQRGRHLTPTI
jgi:hypothetical protein